MSSNNKVLKVRMTGIRNIVWSKTSKTEETKSKVVKYDFIKVRNFYIAKEKNKKNKRNYLPTVP